MFQFAIPLLIPIVDPHLAAQTSNGSSGELSPVIVAYTIYRKLAIMRYIENTDLGRFTPAPDKK